MIIVGRSSGICGTCKAKLDIEWDLDLVDSYEKDMGFHNDYESDVEVVCKKCGNIISAKLWAKEYPEGALEDCGVIIERDDSGGSSIEKPEIEFFDL